MSLGIQIETMLPPELNNEKKPGTTPKYIYKYTNPTPNSPKPTSTGERRETKPPDVTTPANTTSKEAKGDDPLRG